MFKKLEINSQVHPYKVFFTKKINQSLKDDLLVGDIIILDKNIYKLYPQIFDNINNKLILIEASEKAKSYNEIESIICPLSYGNDVKYKKEVINAGKKAFGDKFDETKAEDDAKGMLKKADGDYGAAIGMLQSSVG